MLSRHAESFFWLARNVERAETVARVLDVTYTRSMDLHTGGTWEQRSWRAALAIGMLGAMPAPALLDATSTNVLERCVFDKDNPSSIRASISIARTNAIGLRAELSSEVWEHINQLYLDVQEQGATSIGQRGPSRFLRVVRDRCQAIAGVSDATLPHVDGWNFMQLGRFVERASLATRILATAASFDDPWPEWQRLLEMCCASFPFARAATHLQSPPDAAAFILFNPTFPRSVNFCANRIEKALHRLSQTPGRAYTDDAEKLAGRLCAAVTFADAADIVADGLQPFVRAVLTGLDALVGSIQNVYFPRVPIAAAPLNRGDALAG
jgi:uncharacterized alpha-E superfamily protein